MPIGAVCMFIKKLVCKKSDQSPARKFTRFRDGKEHINKFKTSHAGKQGNKFKNMSIKAFRLFGQSDRLVPLWC